jgi:hypothetical protein
MPVLSCFPEAVCEKPGGSFVKANGCFFRRLTAEWVGLFFPSPLPEGRGRGRRQKLVRSTQSG